MTHNSGLNDIVNCIGQVLVMNKNEATKVVITLDGIFYHLTQLYNIFQKVGSYIHASKTDKEQLIMENLLNETNYNNAGTIIFSEGANISHFTLQYNGSSNVFQIFSNVDRHEYKQENYVFVGYDEQHPKKGRTQKFRLALINCQTKIK